MISIFHYYIKIRKYLFCLFDNLDSFIYYKFKILRKYIEQYNITGNGCNKNHEKSFMKNPLFYQ